MPNLKNKVLFLLDSSGSMHSISRPTVDAFNRVLEAIKAGAQASGQETTVSFYTFGEYQQKVSRKFFDKPIDSFRPLTYGDYRAEGGTPMFDAVGTAITDALALKVDKDTSFVVNVITDGEENESREFTAAAIKKMVQKIQSTDKWTVTFLVPRGAKRTLVSRFDIPEGNVEEWEASQRGAEVASNMLAASYSNYFTARAAGQSSTRGFFTTDLSKVSAKDVKKTLTDISNNVAVLKVGAESDIKSFIENRGYSYVKGNAYYQLTKDEKVQSYKQILLKEKGKTAIYGGSEARQILGLPEYTDVKVRPGNHANWDIYVQSTSVNRKLVRGTTLLYIK